MQTQDKGRGEKTSKRAKQQSRNQHKKTSNDNSNTVCIHKTATSGEKTQGKKQTTGKNYLKRKIIFSRTVKARKGAKTAKQHNEANLGNSPSAQAGQNIFFGFSLKKKPSQSIFFKIKTGTFLLVEKSDGIPYLYFHWTLENT